MRLAPVKTVKEILFTSTFLPKAESISHPYPSRVGRLRSCSITAQGKRQATILDQGAASKEQSTNNINA